MYPDPPYLGYSWPLTRHMGRVSPDTLRHLVYAAAAFANSPNPADRIDAYLRAENVFPHVPGRSLWRDYQQIPSELGLIYSTEVTGKITPTPLGLAYLDGTLTFGEVMTLQGLRYQYPNAQKYEIFPSLREAIKGTPHEQSSKLPWLQQATGVRIRPGVLVWRVLRLLDQEGHEAALTTSEMQSYVMRCASHADTAACVASIIKAREGAISLAPVSTEPRDAQEWGRFLRNSPLFDGSGGGRPLVSLSDYGVAHAEDIDDICSHLEDDRSFWSPGHLDASDRATWYAFFGTIDLDVSLIPPEQEEAAGLPTGEEDEEERPIGTAAAKELSLREFDAAALGSTKSGAGAGQKTITSTYDAGLAAQKHRLHDLMVIYVAETCRGKGAKVYDDPDSVDLLVDYRAMEYLVEVKSVTPRNFVGRLRYALGQVQHYDYLRSLQSPATRRKVVAVTARIQPDAWCIPFLNEHLDIDLLSLEGEVIRVDSRLPLTKELFAPAASGPPPT